MPAQLAFFHIWAFKDWMFTIFQQNIRRRQVAAELEFETKWEGMFDVT